eukprot:4419755-Pyramimonas_sp.AAC.1
MEVAHPKQHAVVVGVGLREGRPQMDGAIVRLRRARPLLARACSAPQQTPRKPNRHQGSLTVPYCA